MSDLDILSPQKPSKTGKNVVFADHPVSEVHIRSPTSTKNRPIDDELRSPLGTKAPMMDNYNNNNNNNNTQTLQQQDLMNNPSAQQQIANSMILLPHQRLINVIANVYHILFIIPHIILHIFMFAITLYAIKLAGDADGFTVYLLLASIFQFAVSFCVTAAASKHTEFSLQIMCVVVGLGLILECISMFLFATGFEVIVKDMRQKYLISLAQNKAENAFVLLYDLLGLFRNLIITFHILDFVGLFLLIGSVKIQIKNLYKICLHSLPFFSPTLLKESIMNRSNPDYPSQLYQRHSDNLTSQKLNHMSQRFSSHTDNMPISPSFDLSTSSSSSSIMAKKEQQQRNHKKNKKAVELQKI